MKNVVLALVLLAVALTPTMTGKSRRSRNAGGGTPGNFDYYLLALSWAPSWCGQDASRGNTAECTPGKHIGFIVHGFWPESESGSSPENCGTAGRVSQSSVKVALPLMLSANLIQHEWATHGTCSGLNQYDYFTALVQARSSVQIPVQLNAGDTESNASPTDIEAQFARANTAFPKDAFRIACTRGELQEVRVCFDKNIKPRACTANVTECHDGKLKVPSTL